MAITVQQKRDSVPKTASTWSIEDRWPDDAKLRAAGYIIWKREKGKEAIWREPGWGKEVTEADALAVVAEMEREIDEALKLSYR